MSIFRYVLAAAALAFGGGGANAACTLTSIRVSNGQVFGSYDPFEAAAHPVTVPLESSGAGTCAGDHVQLTLEADLSTPFALDGTIQLRSGGNTLLARLGDSSGRPVNNLFSGGRSSASLRLGATGDIRLGDLTLILPPGQQVPPGTYSARLIATAVIKDDESGKESSRAAPFGIPVRVVPAVGLAAGSSTMLDLGTLRDGGSAQQPVSFRAYANTGYRITISSDQFFLLTGNV
jgi:hypothetical protein